MLVHKYCTSETLIIIPKYNNHKQIVLDSYQTATNSLSLNKTCYYISVQFCYFMFIELLLFCNKHAVFAYATCIVSVLKQVR